MAATGTTTIRVTTETRDRLNALSSGKLNGATIEETVKWLMDEQWKTEVVAQYDNWRADDPAGFEQHLAEADAMDRQWSPDLDETEGPYFQSPEELQAALNAQETTA